MNSAEIDSLVSSIKEIPLRKVGSKLWTDEHTLISKLNMQAHSEAQTQTKENVVESLIAHKKIQSILHQLLTIEQWKIQIYPKLKVTDSIRSYFILYHEAACLNLLELVLYNEEGVLSLEDSLTDLVDYCARKLVFLNTWEKPEIELTENSDTTKQTNSDLEFTISVSSLSVLRYITDNITKIPLNSVNKILLDHDVISSLTYLIEKSPWLQKDKKKGGYLRFDDGNWNGCEDILVVGKVEVQVWITLYNLLIEPECQKKYQYNPTNHSLILRLREYTTSTLLSQLPFLESLYRYLEQLSLMDPPHTTDGSNKSFILELSTMMSRICDGDMNEVIKEQKGIFSNEDHELNSKLSSLYDLNQLEGFLEDPKCGKCGTLATQRCSRCRIEWYCSRNCQVKSWSMHKNVCNLISEELKQQQPQQSKIFELS